MTRDSRITLCATSAVLALFVIGAAGVSDDANWQRLRSIPREQRQHLSDKLKEFAALDRDTQARVRKLDAKLDALPDGDRANYLAVLRRYHLWHEELSETQRNEIDGVAPEKRMAVVARIAADRTRPRSSSPSALRYCDVGNYSPYELANQVQVWQVLTPAQKADLSRLAEGPRTLRLERIAADRNVAPVARPAKVDEEATIKKAMRHGLSAFLNNKPIGDRLKEPKVRSRMIDHLTLMEWPPEKVSSDNLARFAEALPPWVRSLDDPLPPDEARRRLTVLYRLLYPAPAEYVPPKAAPAAPAKAAPAAPAAPVQRKPAGISTTPF